MFLPKEARGHQVVEAVQPDHQLGGLHQEAADLLSADLQLVIDLREGIDRQWIDLREGTDLQWIDLREVTDLQWIGHQEVIDLL